MTDPVFEQSAREIVDRAVAELTQAGYTVVREPTPEELPDQLKDFRPDYIARLGDEVIVGEVKSKERVGSGVDLETLANIVNGIQGWRLELIWLGDEPDAVPTEDDIEHVAESVRAVARINHDAALLLAWAGVEAAVERLSRRVGLELNRNAPVRRKIAELYSLGWLSDVQYEMLQQAGQARNETAHLIPNRSTPTIDLDKLLHLAVWLSDPEYVSVDQMIEWFLANYEDPAEHVPFDSSEGGYQYVAGGPFDANEALSEKFESAPEDQIDEAAQRLNQYSFEWVRKYDY